MFEYYMLLRLRTKKPVYPLVLYLVSGTGGITRETYEEKLFGQTIVAFEFGAVALPDMSADGYMDGRNPLGPALAALMRPSRNGRARQKLESLLQVVRAPIDEARKSLLAHVVESYLKLNKREGAEYDTLLSELPSREVGEMVTIFEQRGFEKGIEKGIERGIESGKARGVRIAKREALAKVVRLRFSSVPNDLDARLDSVEEIEVLDQLFDRALTVGTLDEVGLPNITDAA